jgi:hypothetical protein
MGGGGGGRTEGKAGSNLFPKGVAQIKHIFHKKHGLKDTKENREMILETVRDKNNFLGVDKNGKDWFAININANEQLWVNVHGGKIQNAGINRPPLTDWNFMKEDA